MSDVTNRPLSSALRTNVVAHLLGSFAVGSVVLAAAFLVGQGLSASFVTSAGFDILSLTPELMVLVALGVALVRPFRRFAWLVAAAGLFGLAGLFLQDDSLQRDQLLTLLAMCAGLQFAGLLLAFADAGRPGRWAIAVGFGAGAIAGKYTLGLAVWAVRDGLFSGSLHGDDAMVALLGAVAAAAGLIVLWRPQPDPEAADAKPAPVRGSVIWLVAAAVAAVVLSRLWQLVLDDIAQSSTGGMSQDQAEAVESTDVLIRVLIGATVGVILLVGAYRRGGASLARWVVVASGVSATSVAIPTVFDSPASAAGALSELDLFVQGAVPAAIGAVAGAAAVRFVDRRFPWDALGMALAAAAVLVTTNQGRIDLPDLIHPAIVLGSFGLGLALTAGLARLAEPDGRGLSANDVSISAGFGVAALVLCQQVISPVSYLVRQDVSSPELAVPLTMLGAAAVLVVLFGLGRLVQRPRTDLVTEGVAGEG
jgi:hypothetical protein